MKERKPVPLFSIREAAARGVERVYQPNWVNPLDHIKIDVIDGTFGPWLHLFSPCNKMVNGRDPVDMLAIPPIDVDSKSFYAYVGPLPESQEYQAESAARAAVSENTDTR